MNKVQTEHCFDGFVESRIGGRVENQDAVSWTDTPFGLLVIVCDGMGGGPGGRTASNTVVEVVIREINSAETDSLSLEDCSNSVKKSIEKANEVIASLVAKNKELKGMGTTIAMALFHKDSAVVAHVGDSRVYSLRNFSILLNMPFKIFRTADHSFVGELVRNGSLKEEQARLSANSNIITRAIGSSYNSDPEIDIVPYCKGDCFLICSDGIWGSMIEKKLINLAFSSKSPSTVVERISNIVDRYGNQKGGSYDNHTIALISCGIDSNKKGKICEKLKLEHLLFMSFFIILIFCHLLLLLFK